MRVWEVTESDYQMRFFWYATKKEALAHRRAYQQPEGWEHGDCTIRSTDFKAGRAGLVEALNWVIELTCFNEG
jgi:hypothetical protein